MIQFTNVTKEYSNSHCALSEVSFAVNPGEMVFLTGHSGAGKSTILKLIARLEVANKGIVKVMGENVAKFSRRKTALYRRKLGLIFQNPHLLDNRSVFDNVALPLVIAGIRRNDIARRVRAALDKVGLLQFEKDLPATLSTGEQQRVGIARAIVTKPAVLLADEPTGNLDPDLSWEIMRLFQSFNQVGVTILIATHDISLIKKLDNRQLVLSHGHLISNQQAKIA